MIDERDAWDNPAIGFLWERSLMLAKLEQSLGYMAEILWNQGYDIEGDSAQFQGPRIETEFGSVPIAALVASWGARIRSKKP